MMENQSVNNDYVVQLSMHSSPMVIEKKSNYFVFLVNISLTITAVAYNFHVHVDTIKCSHYPSEILSQFLLIHWDKPLVCFWQTLARKKMISMER